MARVLRATRFLVLVPIVGLALAAALFFVLGGVLLAKVDVRRGILDAGNEVPRVV